MGQHVRQVVSKAVMVELHDKMLLHSSTSSLCSFFSVHVERVCLLHSKVILWSVCVCYTGS